MGDIPQKYEFFSEPARSFTTLAAFDKWVHGVLFFVHLFFSVNL